MESSGSGTVIEPLLALEREDSSGVLEFRAREITTRIFVRGGMIVFAEGGSVNETLGRLLIRSGRLTEEQVVAVLRRMTDALVDNTHIRFGEVVVEYGFLSADELDAALTQQVKEKVMGCVHRSGCVAGEWTFTKDDPQIEEVGSYIVGTRPVLVEATLHLPERLLEDILHLDENRYPEVVAPESILVEEFELANAEASILRELDGTSSLHFILSTTKVPNILALLAALVLGGGVELRQTPTGTRQSSEGRAVPPEFRTQRRARFRLESRDAKGPQAVAVTPNPQKAAATADATESSNNKKPAPPRVTSTHSSPTLAVAYAAPEPRRSSRQNLTVPTTEAQERAKEALERLKADLEGRKPVSSRRRWPLPKDDKERRLMAESAFHRGRIYLRAEDAERALPGLHRAHELRPEEREYELYMKWAQMLVNDAFKNDPQRSEIHELAAAIVREDRNCSLGFSILGHCAMHDGKEEAALRFFQRATALDPKLVDAARLARLLQMRTDGSHRKQLASKSDHAPGRSRLRGTLDTPIDEIVPTVLQRAVDIAQRMVSSPALVSDMKGTSGGNSVDPNGPNGGIAPAHDAASPLINASQGGKGVDLAPRTERIVTPISSPAPPRTSTPARAPSSVDRRPLSIPPPINTPRAYPPPPSIPPPRPGGDVRISRPDGIERLESTPSAPPPPLELPGDANATQPLTALAPWRPPSTSVSQPPTAVTQMSPAIAPAPPQQHARIASAAPPHHAQHVALSHQPAMAASSPPPRGPIYSIPDPPPPKRRAGIVFVWIASLGITGGLAYYFGLRDAQHPPQAPSLVSATSTSSSTTTDTAALTSGGTLGVLTGPVTSLSNSPSVSAPIPLPSSSATTAASGSSSAAADGVDGGVGTLRTRHAYGRRIFVDGHIVGEGGRDLVVPCGVHRVRVGSAGVERSMTIPCGSAIELD